MSVRKIYSSCRIVVKRYSPRLTPSTSLAYAGPVLAPAILPLLAALAAAASATPPRGTVPPSETADAARAFDRGDYAQALTLARRRLAAVPRDARARLVMARAQAALGDFEGAYAGFRRALALDPRSTDALYYLAILGGVLAQGEYDRLLAQAPGSSRARQLLGDLHSAQHRPAEAEAEYKAALDGAPGSLEVLIALGDLTRRQSRLEEALAYYARAAEIAPKDYDVLYGIGVCRSYRQEYAAAIESFRAALGVDPSSAPARLALGHALLQSGQAAAAVPELESAARLEPRMLQAQYLLGRAYRLLGRTEEAGATMARVQQLVQGQAAEEVDAGPAGESLPSPEAAATPPPDRR
jgi:tetratricopeptide (TPR) repeat protein